MASLKSLGELPSGSAEQRTDTESGSTTTARPGDSSPDLTSASLPREPEHDAEKATPSQKPLAPAPPDGGAKAWLVILGAWCASFCSFGWVNSIGVFQEYYQNTLLKDYSSSTISWIPALQIFFVMGTGPFVGYVYDRYGPRWLLLGGSFLHVFGLMMASLSTEYYQILLAQGLCSGIGVSAVFQPSLSCAAGWFNKKRATAFGILFTGSSVGGIVIPLMVSRLIRSIGFPWAMRTGAFLLLALLIITNLTVRPFQPPIPQKKTTLAQLSKPLGEVQFQLTMVGFFFFSFGFFVPINYITVQAIDEDMRPNLADAILPVLNAASLIGRLLSGFLGDKLGRYNVFLIAGYLTSIWILALWLPAAGEAALFAFAILFGVFSGAFIPLTTPMIMQISPMAEIGYRTGIVFFTAAISGLAANPVSGAILEGSGGWTGLKVFCGVVCVVGTTAILVGRIKKTGWKLLVLF
ncbi:related to monocarboxylate transporter 2 [Cephalotrichum gorgonifer]|uniref:Related to monocarboxylate transporter 2 n=1 Tax=Cephalotrichum gorgonifer TaxID=2041049 RepID=A0AAE8N452_9PEZI|nr:related to monocarboxylate transporter 2 [Cephalotrichum gorgonifer]